MNDFLRSAEEQLELNKDKASVMAELKDHVETKRSFFRSIGYDESTSAEKANEAMGNGEIIGQRLNQIHSRMGKASVYLIVASVIANLGLNAAILLADKSNYSIPFAAALFILLCNLAFTYAAIKFKSLWLSAASMIFSLAAVWLSSPHLTYPLCNLIISNYGDDPSEIYRLSSIVISLCLCVLTFLPNIFNVYHCVQMKRLKNTKKQNHIAAALRNACFIIGVLIFVLSFPYYAMNNSLCEEQAQIREELMDFAFETANEYNFKVHTELEEFLKNTKYDFEDNSVFEDENPVFQSTTFIYTYKKGNWEIEFHFHNSNYKPQYGLADLGYTINIRNMMFNISQRYLIISSESASLPFYSVSSSFNNIPYHLYASTYREDIFPIGHVQQNQQDYPQRINRSNWFHTATAEYQLTTEKTRNTFNRFSLLGIKIYKYEKVAQYTFQWLDQNDLNDLFVRGYDFFFDDDGLCTGYYQTSDDFALE